MKEMEAEVLKLLARVTFDCRLPEDYNWDNLLLWGLPDDPHSPAHLTSYQRD